MKFTVEDRGENRPRDTRRYAVHYPSLETTHYSDTLPPENPKEGDLWQTRDGWMFWSQMWISCKSFNKICTSEFQEYEIFNLFYRYGDLDRMAEEHETIRKLRDQLLVALKLVNE